MNKFTLEGFVDKIAESIYGAKMTEKEVFDKVKDIVAKQLNINENMITRTSSFRDLGADSLDTVELIMSFEEEFNIQIPDMDAAQVSRIQDVINYIKNKLV